MSREFSKVSAALWRSRRFQSLESDARLVHLYILTCNHQTSAGCFRLPDAYAAADLGWPAERYIEARAKLIDADLISFDPATEEIYVNRWFKHNPPTNDKHASGTMKLLVEIESDALRERAEQEFTEVNMQRTQRAMPRTTLPSGLGSR